MYEVFSSFWQWYFKVSLQMFSMNPFLENKIESSSHLTSPVPATFSMEEFLVKWQELYTTSLFEPVSFFWNNYLKFFSRTIPLESSLKGTRHLELFRSLADMAPLTTAVYQPGEEISGWWRMDEETRDPKIISLFTQAFKEKNIPQEYWPARWWFFDETSGFRAAAFLRKKSPSSNGKEPETFSRELVISFCPTYLTSHLDWWTNFSQSYGGNPRQHRLAKQFAQHFFNVFGPRMKIVGTSLGASLAAYATMNCLKISDEKAVCETLNEFPRCLKEGKVDPYEILNNPKLREAIQESSATQAPRCILFNPAPLGEGSLEKIDAKLAWHEKYILSFSMTGDMASDPCETGHPICSQLGAACLGTRIFFPKNLEHVNPLTKYFFVDWHKMIEQFMLHSISSFPFIKEERRRSLRPEMLAKPFQDAFKKHLLSPQKEFFEFFLQIFPSSQKNSSFYGPPPFFKSLEKTSVPRDKNRIIPSNIASKFCASKSTLTATSSYQR